MAAENWKGNCCPCEEQIGIHLRTMRFCNDVVAMMAQVVVSDMPSAPEAANQTSGCEVQLAAKRQHGKIRQIPREASGELD